MDIKGVHIGAQADGAVGPTPAKGADDAGFTKAPVDLQPPFGQKPRNNISGPVFLIRHFRVLMDIAPNFTQIIGVGFDDAALYF
ncbi:MAG: hypothetical protein ACJAU6_003923 [Alphaproteobacteria bacterium]